VVRTRQFGRNGTADAAAGAGDEGCGTVVYFASSMAWSRPLDISSKVNVST
jgi:hypothetical protein